MLRNDEEMLCVKISNEVMEKLREFKSVTHRAHRYQVELALIEFFSKNKVSKLITF